MKEAVAPEAVIVRPGDKLIVRVRHDVAEKEFDEFRERLSEKLPGVDLVLLNAEQMLVYRPDGDA